MIEKNVPNDNANIIINDDKWFESVYTDGTRYFVSNPYPKKGDTININIRMYENSPVKAVFLRTVENGGEHLYPMEIDRCENGLLYRYCRVTVYEDVFHYHFYLVTDDTLYYYNQLEITTCLLDEQYDFKILVGNNQPKWVKESVFYQIFPDRFCNGDKNIDVKSNEYTFEGHPSIRVEDWNQVPKRYNESYCMDFYGGDLIGLRKKIPYLKNLGITALYINPIFASATVHKYDCVDYFTVDSHLGGDKALKELCEELHRNGIKVIIDISINHTGTAHKWFNKEGIFYDKSIGAYNNKDCTERQYYTFDDETNDYACWWGVRTLPTLNYKSDKLREKLYRNRDSVLKKWLDTPYKIDGWRFDVAEVMARSNEIQLHHEVWPEINKAIKDTNPNAYILGESWCDCNEFLQGNEWDSAMNYYGFTRPVREFMGENDLHGKTHELLKKVSKKLTAKDLSKRIKQHLLKLPTVIQENQFNFLDSHDVPRLHNNESVRFDEYRGAVIMMFTMIGTPSIYYGDEAQIDGRIDDVEGCRYPMPWDKDYMNGEFYKLYSTLAHFKNKIEAFRYGGFKIIHEEDYVFAFTRFTQDELWVTIVSTDDEERTVEVPMYAYGKTHFSCDKDVLGTSISYVIRDGRFYINVKPHTSYLIGF